MYDRETLQRVTSELWEKPGLPRELAWLRRLSDVHQRRFIVELSDAARSARRDDSWDQVGSLLSRWRDVSSVDARHRLPYRLRYGAGDETPRYSF